MLFKIQTLLCIWFCLFIYWKLPELLNPKPIPQSNPPGWGELFTDRELRDARTLKNFTMLPDAASLLHPLWRTHCVWRAPLALFLLYSELFYDRELFTDLELREARTRVDDPHLIWSKGQKEESCA